MVLPEVMKANGYKIFLAGLFLWYFDLFGLCPYIHIEK